CPVISQVIRGGAIQEMRRAPIARERALELLAIWMIGEGLVLMADPRGHLHLWRRGPSWWSAMVDPFLARPGMMRLLGGAELVVGVELARWAIGRGEVEEKP